MGEFLEFPPALLDFVRNRRTYSEPSNKDCSTKPLPLDRSTTSNQHDYSPPFISTCFSVCSGGIRSDSVTKDQEIRGSNEQLCSCPKPSGLNTWTCGLTRKCVCACFRCRFNVKYSCVFGFVLLCGNTELTFDDDLYLINGLSKMATNTQLLKHERYIVECYYQLGFIPFKQLECEIDSIRRSVLRTRAYLQELSLFSPVSRADGSIYCATCEKDDGFNGCICKRIFLSFDVSYDFSLEQLKKDWIYFHFNIVELFINDFVIDMILSFISDAYLTFCYSTVWWNYKQFQLLWNSVSRPPEFGFTVT